MFGHNKMALITGAEQGLGLAIAAALDLRGWAVHGMPREVVRDGCLAIRRYMHQLRTTIGDPSLVINNFGINHLSWIGETPHDDKKIVEINLLAPYWVVDELASIRRHLPCKVINVASATYRVPQRTSALYCASKAGLVQMTKVMARELAPHGWVVNAIAPGSMEGTEMTIMVRDQVMKLRGWSETEMNLYEQQLIPMGRITSPQEVADATMKLIDMPDYVNGICLDIMGGV